MSKIIEIIELSFPKSLIQRENEPCSEMIKTEEMMEEVNEILQSQQEVKIEWVKIESKIENPKSRKEQMMEEYSNCDEERFRDILAAQNIELSMNIKFLQSLLPPTK